MATNDKKSLTTGQIIFIIFVGLLVLGLFTGGNKPTTTTTHTWCQSHASDAYQGGQADNDKLLRYMRECTGTKP